MSKVGLREFYTVGMALANGQLLRYSAENRGYTARFESQLAGKFDAAHVLTVNSGTSALITALAAAGVGPGDEVLVPAYTWVATAIAPLAVGAVPVLVNIDESLTIDPADIEKKISAHTKAIIPVHMLNLVCDMDAIMDIARRHNLVVVEDACQCVGGIYKGRRVGSIGDFGALSFNHFKNMTSGEGGAVLCRDEAHFERARMYHDPGSFIRGHSRTNEPIFAAMNFRVSELTGAMLYAQLSRLDGLVARLKARRRIMTKGFSELQNCRISPHYDPDNAMGLTVIFDREADAEAFGRNRGVSRLIETNRHVFTNWEAVLCKRFFNDRMNPHRWAHREIDYDPDDYKRTLDILKRTCHIHLGAEKSSILIRIQRMLLSHKATRLGGSQSLIGEV